MAKCYFINFSIENPHGLWRPVGKTGEGNFKRGCWDIWEEVRISIHLLAISHPQLKTSAFHGLEKVLHKAIYSKVVCVFASFLYSLCYYNNRLPITIPTATRQYY